MVLIVLDSVGIGELPDADKEVLTIGGSYKINDKFTVDLTYAYENVDERKGNYAQENFSGQYKTRVYIIGVGVNFSW